MLRPNPNAFASGGVVGYVDVSYAKIVEVFGEPNGAGDEYKIDAIWVIEDTKTGKIAHIYNYKDGYNYLGRPPEQKPAKTGTPTAKGEYEGLHEADDFSASEYGMAVEDITDWHVGGDRELLPAIAKALGVMPRK